jgi:hypothetical protein
MQYVLVSLKMSLKEYHVGNTKIIIHLIYRNVENLIW